MLSLSYIQTSVFIDTRHAFGGNQLATFWDVSAIAKLSQSDMQGIALEMHFSETTFIEKPVKKEADFKVRIFTPASEIPFAGHPTLGSAFVIKQKDLLSPTASQATLELGIGPILVEFISEDVIRMSQPQPSFLEQWDDAQTIAETVELAETDISDKFPMQFVATGHPFLIVPINSLSAIQRAQPNTRLILEQLEGHPSKNILLYCTEVVHKDSHVHARMFAPDVGVIEDPATGSAAGPLAAYLEHHQVLPKANRGQPIFIEQGYEMHRPSQLIAEVVWNKEMQGVLVSGKIKRVAEGNFFLEKI